LINFSRCVSSKKKIISLWILEQIKNGANSCKHRVVKHCTDPSHEDEVMKHKQTKMQEKNDQI